VKSLLSALGSRLSAGGRLLTVAAAASLLVSCNDGTSPPEEIRATEELTFLRPAPNAPALADTTVRFIARRGRDSEVRIRYAVAPDQFEEFVRFRVRDDALLAYPDGRPFRDGDEIEITVRVVDFARLIVEFQPSGLRFNPQRPAELTFKYNHTDQDRDADGDVDSRDAEIETLLAVWRQESPGQPWVKQVSKVEISIDEIEADITGFTGYALAY
jgi:hypothetical protein